MPASRLLGILMILLKEEKVSIGSLAERFEVSERTIYRDIDRLSQGGIPIICHRGRNGGVSLLSDFKLSKSYLTEQELHLLIHALTFYLQFVGYKDVSDVCIAQEARILIDKLSAISPDTARETLHKIETYYYVDMEECLFPRTNHSLEHLFQGMKSRKKVELRVWSRKMVVNPISFVVRPNGTNLYSYGSEGYQLIRLKDISKAVVLEETIQEGLLDYAEYSRQLKEL